MARIPLQSIDVNLTTKPKKSAEIPSNITKNIYFTLRQNIEDNLVSSYQPYLIEAMAHFYESEAFFLEPLKHFQTVQTEISFHMRCLLLDWLMEIHYKLKFVPETLYLAINIVDRFLGLYDVPKNKLQVLGLVSLIIAAKYEEIQPPSIETFVSLVPGLSDNELRSVERYVLQKLDYRLDMPSPLNFLRIVSKADNYDERIRSVAKYLVEITFFDEKLNTTRFSVRAVAAMYISRIIYDRRECEDLFWEYSGFNKPDLLGCIRDIIILMQKEPSYEFIKRKFGSSRFGRAYRIVRDAFKDENIA